MEGGGGVAGLAPLTAGLLAQHALKLWRTDTLLVLGARPTILAQEQLLVTHISCRRERDGGGRGGRRERGEGSGRVRRCG